MALQFDIQDKAVNARLSKVISKVRNKLPFFKKTQIIMLRDIQKHFQEKKGSGGPWPPVSKPYALWKSKQGKSPENILVFSGELRKSIVGRATNNEASVGTNIEYASRHQFGEGNLPKREFLWLSENARNQIMNELSKHIMD